MQCLPSECCSSASSLDEQPRPHHVSACERRSRGRCDDRRRRDVLTIIFRGRPKYSVSGKSDTGCYEVAYPRASGPTAPGSSFRADNGFIYLSKYKFDPVSSAFEDIETSLVLLDTGA